MQTLQISTALTSSSKEIWAYNLDDMFDELFTNVEIQDSIVVRCDMCYKTSHGPRNFVGRSSNGEQKAKGEAGLCHGENKLRGCLMPQTRPHHSTHFFFKCSEAVANSFLTTPSSLLCWTSSSSLCTAFICTFSTLSFLSSSLLSSSQPSSFYRGGSRN